MKAKQPQHRLIPTTVNNRVVAKVVKNLVNNPTVAIIELIANSWDAGATRVDITWPTNDATLFEISDNGCGMNNSEFIKRWMDIGYNRQDHQGNKVNIDINGNKIERYTFGKNGIGKFAALCFANIYEFATWKEGKEYKYIIKNNIATSQFDATPISEKQRKGNGTKISAIEGRDVKYPEKIIKEEIAQRFFFDPTFQVILNGKKINFDALPDKYVAKKEIDIDGQKIEMLIVSRNETDRTLKFSGIAWHVKKRLVGSLSWSALTEQSILDGRTAQAKRHAVILKADCLIDAVLEDWTGFDQDNDLYKKAVKEISRHLSDFLISLTEDNRQQKSQEIKQATKNKLDKLGHISREKVETFIDNTLVSCPTIKTKDLENITAILATLEETKSKYGILEKLAEFEISDWDNLEILLSEWTITMAKEALDEIKGRLKLIEEFKRLTTSLETLEVKELQPLMGKCLWMFGPEFESIHFTSNQSIATCFSKLKGITITGASLNRPDFVITPDGSVSFHSTYGFDEDHHEDKISHLVIVELKAPSVPIGLEEKTQPLKYINEFISKGLIDNDTKINAFVLGSRKEESLQMGPLKEGQNIVIKVMLFSSLLARAESRLFGLRERLQSAPFMSSASKQQNGSDSLLN